MGFLLGITYTLTHPDGTIAVFNAPSDPNFVGYLTDIAGLDSPEVREQGDVYVERDGGINGNNYFGRRPIVLEGLIPQSAEALRQARIEKIQRVTNAMRSDVTLTWTEPQDSIQRRILLRRQAPVRITGGVDKRFTLGLVSASHLIESASTTTTTDNAAPLSMNVTNSGNAEAMPVVRVSNVGGAGVTVSPLTVTIAGVTAYKLNYAIPVGRRVDFDCMARTVKDDTGANLYQYLDFAATTWKCLPPGASVAAADRGTILDVIYRHSWV